MEAGLNGPGQLRRFQFERDAFSFANELVWEYRFDATTGRATTFRCNPPPTYTQRCFVVIRAARQFLYHARFDPAQAVAGAAEYRRLIRAVMSGNPRRPSPSERRVVVPGYDGLRSFSRAHERLLKAECGGAWQSYFLRSHWRIIYPISRRHQARMERQLIEAFPVRLAPLVHLVRFPALTINHGILLFDVAETQGGWRFGAYDPNDPDRPTELIYDRETRTFLFPRLRYWPGGRVDVIEIYRGVFY
jgi:hypothetical protein